MHHDLIFKYCTERFEMAGFPNDQALALAGIVLRAHIESGANVDDIVNSLTQLCRPNTEMLKLEDAYNAYWKL